jgi:hypothetical protein
MPISFLKSSYCNRHSILDFRLFSRVLGGETNQNGGLGASHRKSKVQDRRQ